jgi:thioredoxin reductase (NADPH)
MMQRFRDQAERFGARLVSDNAEKVELASEPAGVHRVWVGGEEHAARTVVLAMGAEHKKLGVPGEEDLAGRGVSYCATCDAAFFKDARTLIVGGGDSAMEEAIFLSKFASKVSIVHRRNDFRASKIMLERARAQQNIEFLTPYRVEQFIAADHGALGHARLVNTEDGSTLELPIAGSFIAIGHEPQSELVRGQIDLDENGYVRTEAHSTRTNRPGVFAAGDLVDHTYRQAVTPPALAVRPRSTRSGTCATRPACPPRGACRWAIPRSPSGRACPRVKRPPFAPHLSNAESVAGATARSPRRAHASAPSSSSRKRLRSSPPP